MSTRQSIAAATMAFTLVVSSLPLSALVPAPRLHQYAHTAWKLTDGFAYGSTIRAVAQAPDGYLLLGTNLGVLRFDGVRAVPWQPSGQSLPTKVSDLLVSRDGTLWIATLTGLASWKDGKLTRYAELEGHVVIDLVEDREGAIWAVGTRTKPYDILCSFRNRRAQCHGTDGSLPGIYGLFVDRKGTLWAGADNGLWRWHPGVPRFYPTSYSERNRVHPLGEDDDGTLLVGVAGGIRRFVDGRMEVFPLPRTMPLFGATRAFRDRNGGMWIAAGGHGLLHVREGKAEWFAETDGLSRNAVLDVFGDREGNIWTVTLAGIDRFRERAVAPIVASSGLESSVVESVLAAKDGAVWFATRSGLIRWRDGQLTMVGVRGVPTSLFQDASGRVWVTTRSGAGYLDDDRFIPFKAVPAGWVQTITADAAGDLWMAHWGVGLIHLLGGSQVEQIPWRRLVDHDRRPLSLAADPQGGIWVGYVHGGLVHFANGKVRASYTDTDGLGNGDVEALRFDREGTLWAATWGGLSRLKHGRVSTLTLKTGLPCDGRVYWTIDDNLGSMWMYLECGIVRVARAEIDAVFAALDEDKNTDRRVHATLFDNADGVRRSGDGLSGPVGAMAADGRLWFSPGNGVSVLDPRRIPFSALPPPPVHIEQLIADHQPHEAMNDLRLPPLVRDLQIEYTGLSLGVPEKVQFRYKLEGHDPEWQEVGTRRQAFYSNLGPGKHRFRVSARNNMGVWNEAGAFVDFTIDPAYYQTSWFQLSVAVALIALLSAVYQMRARQQARQLNLLFEERLAERTRLARDLHDTMMQTIQGSKMVADSALKQPEDSGRERIALERVAHWLDRAVHEGRAALHSLRTSDEHLDLVEALRRVARSQCEPLSLAATVSALGPAKPVSPHVRDDVYRIGEEAIRNVCAHALATSLNVELQFGRDLILSVRDDGKGIDQDAANRGREGHFGVLGMQERARQIGGALTIQGTTTGTHVTLVVPGDVAFT